MIDTINIRKIWGQQVVFFTFSKEFFVKFGDKEFRDTQLDHLIKKVEMSQIIMLNEEVYYKDSMRFDKMKIVRLEHFGEFFHDEFGNQHRLEDCFPITKENEDVMKEAQKIHDDGWELIRKSDSIKDEKLHKFPKNYWNKVLEKKIKEYSKVD